MRVCCTPGSHTPTHVHSDFIVLNGGQILCDKPGVVGAFARVWVKKGGKVDTNCLGGYVRCVYASTRHGTAAHRHTYPPHTHTYMLPAYALCTRNRNRTRTRTRTRTRCPYANRHAHSQRRRLIAAVGVLLGVNSDCTMKTNQTLSGRPRGAKPRPLGGVGPGSGERTNVSNLWKSAALTTGRCSANANATTAAHQPKTARVARSATQASTPKRTATRA